MKKFPPKLRKGLRLTLPQSSQLNTMLKLNFAVALCVLVGVSNAALGAQALTSKTVNLRAGPGKDYPLVARLPPNRNVNVLGCVNGYTWCDVSVAGNGRGWVYGGNLTALYQRRRVSLISYGAVVGFPVVVFSINSYWNDHYRQQQWYRERSRWSHRPHFRPSPHRPQIQPPVIARPGGPGIFPPPQIGRPPPRPRPPITQPGPRPTKPSRPEGR